MNEALFLFQGPPGLQGTQGTRGLPGNVVGSFCGNDNPKTFYTYGICVLVFEDVPNALN